MNSIEHNPAPLVVDEITLDGKRVQVQSIDLPLDQVTLDPYNPRIANTFSVGTSDLGSELQLKLEALLWDDSDVRDLYRQVLINHGLIERIIVRQDGRVVEGNCRTVVYRKLRENQPLEARWQQIPARVLPADIGERDVAILLGEMHVAGKNTWTPFEKAGHVYKMHNEFALVQDEIALRLRMSKSKVNQLVRAFDMMKTKYITKYPGPASSRKFSYFEELFKKPPLREWMSATPGAEELFVDWIGTGKLDQGVQVRDLPAIIEDPDALAALSSEGFLAAQKVLAEDNPVLTSKLFRRMVEMTEALLKAQMDDVQRVRKAKGPKAKRIVLELQESLEHFVELCGIEN
ncbi:MAG: hypothetical protein JWM43_3489 [Acidobacteriaceae bacterium]|nr:hypothetical protein [Acidobacteriaceae bacterium]